MGGLAASSTGMDPQTEAAGTAPPPRRPLCNAKRVGRSGRPPPAGASYEWQRVPDVRITQSWWLHAARITPLGDAPSNGSAGILLVTLRCEPKRAHSYVPRPRKGIFCRVDEPETLLRLGGRVGGVRRAACLGWSAGGTNGAHKPARVRVWLGPGRDLRRRLDWASALRSHWPSRWLADGPHWAQASYALRPWSYRFEYL